jgi:hypothetical protein
MFHEEVLKDCVLFSCQSEDEHADAKLAVDFTKKMQGLRGADGNVVDKQDLMQEQVGRRKTVLNIHENHHFVQNNQAPLSLDSAFERRISQIEQNNGKNIIHCVTF